MKRARYSRRTALPAGSLTLRHQIGWTTKLVAFSCFSACCLQRGSGSDVRSRTMLRFVAKPVCSEDFARSNAISFTAMFVLARRQQIVDERGELGVVSGQAPDFLDEARAVLLVGPARGQVDREAIPLVTNPRRARLGSGRHGEDREGRNGQEERAHAVCIDRRRSLR